MISDFLSTLQPGACDEAQRKLLEKAEFKGYDLSILLCVDSYGNLAYNVGQMHSIIMGYKSGVDVNVYAVLHADGTPIYSADMMEELRFALLDNIDIKLLTKLDENDVPIYSDRMMWLIHEAYMYNLDIDMFAVIVNNKQAYNDYQACEIFLGEKAGFDVSSYAVLTDDGVPVYTAEEMKAKRLAMEAAVNDEYSYINSHV